MNPYQAAALRRRASMVGAMGFQTPQLVGYSGYPQLVGGPGGSVALQGQNPGSMGTVMVPGQPSDSRLWILPFPSTTIGGGGVGTASSSVQVPLCRPNRLILTDSAGAGSLTDITIGQRSQFIATGNCPIATFGPTAVDTLINFDTATTGQNINLFYANGAVGSTTILATALCTVAV